MNWRKTRETIVNWWYGVAATTAAIALIAPFLTAPTDEDPTGGAGLLAPVVALCVAAIILTEAIRTGRLEIRKFPSICIGLGSVGSAYLWMAAENNAHPLAPELPLNLAIIFAISAVLVLIFPFTRGNWGSNN